MEHQSILKLIRYKRDGKELNEEEFQIFVNALGTPNISQAQIGAFLMAVYLNDLSLNEIKYLTKAMTFSGTTLEWPLEWKGSIVDKHATGGVGDKTSLVLAPALAACGLRVPMISGRSLGHTGGTLDKMESIPGFNIHLSPEQILESLKSAGCCIVSQTEDIVPADKILYALRDATATVGNDGLIVGSIISKKAAEGLDALVLDVKFGSGTIIKELEAAESLANKLVSAGQGFGIKMNAVLSRMEAPLGNAVGNALEVAEAIDTMQGNGPDDLVELVAALGAKLLKCTGRVKSIGEGKVQIKEVICNGSALNHFRLMLTAQGCGAEVVEELCRGDKWSILPKAPNKTPLLAQSHGYIESLDAFAVGSVSHALGSNGSKMRSGVMLKKKPGDAVAPGDVILELHHDSQDISSFVIKLNEAVKITSQEPTIPPLLHKAVNRLCNATNH